MACPYTDWNGILEEGDIGIVTIRPLESDPKFLGFPPEYDLPEDHPLKDMAYAQMKRPAKLPKLRSEDRDFKCRASKEYFMKLWNGDVEMHWKEVWNVDTDVNGFYLCVVADDTARDLISTLDPVPPLHHDKYVLAIRMQPVGGNNNFQPEANVGYSPFTNLQYDNSPLKSFYHLSQLESLMFRMMHRFYRVHAYDLTHFFLDQMNSQLKIFYMRENSWFTESIDVLMIWSDVNLFDGRSERHKSQMYPVLCLAKALQAKGKFKQAAAMTEDVIDHWEHLNNQMSRRNPQNSIDSTTVMKNAGQAHHHANDLVEAERCFARAIWIDCNQQERRGVRTPLWEWDATVFEAINLLVTVYSLYHIIHHVADAGLLSYDEMADIGHLDPRLFPILTGLLHTAVQDTPAYMNVRKTYSINVVACVGQVKNKFVASPNAARLALKKAATSETLISVEEFRNNLYSYHNTKKSPFVMKVPNPRACLHQLDIRRSAEDHCKKQIREQVHRSSMEGPEGYMQMAACSNCKMIFPRSAIKRCPCKEVEYCGADCQMAAWRAGHKLTCAAKKKKRSSSGSARSSA